MKRGMIGDVEVEVLEVKKQLQAGDPKTIEDRFFVRYDLVTFKQAGKTPVFLAIEAPDNSCRDVDWRERLDSHAEKEQQWDRHQLHSKVRPEETEWYEKRDDGRVDQIKFVTPTQGQRRNRCDGIHDASIEKVDEAIKKNLGTTRNVASEYLKNGLEPKALDLKKEDVYEKEKEIQKNQNPTRTIAEEYRKDEVASVTPEARQEQYQQENAERRHKLKEKFKEVFERVDTLMDMADLPDALENVKKQKL